MVYSGIQSSGFQNTAAQFSIRFSPFGCHVCFSFTSAIGYLSTWVHQRNMTYLNRRKRKKNNKYTLLPIRHIPISNEWVKNRRETYKSRVSKPLAAVYLSSKTRVWIGEKRRFNALTAIVSRSTFTKLFAIFVGRKLLLLFAVGFRVCR